MDDPRLKIKQHGTGNVVLIVSLFFLGGGGGGGGEMLSTNYDRSIDQYEKP